MIEHVRTMFRTFKRTGSHFLINVLGLGVGITVSLFVFLYVKDELSYDKFHNRYQDIYRVALTLKFEDLDVFQPMASPPVAATLKSEIPEVEEVTRLYGFDLNLSFRYNDKAFTEKKVLFADSNFFQFFSFRLEKGDLATALVKPQSVVLTQTLATKYFGLEDPLGKLILIDGDTYSVTGIVAPPPSNSHIVFDALISMRSDRLSESTTWMFNRFFTYLKLYPGADVSVVEGKMDDIVKNHIGPDLENSLGITLQQFLSQGNKIGYDLFAMKDTHLISRFPKDIVPAGDIKYVYIFIAVGLAMLVVACINFMNLSTARAAERMKNISIRRTLGSSRRELLFQFLFETFFLTLISAALSVIAVYVLLPQFNLISGKDFSPFDLMSVDFVTALVLVIVTCTLLSGFYPALYLTSAKITEVLRGRIAGGLRAKRIRSTLVVFQNCVSIGLIVFTIVLYQQVDYLTSVDLGFRQEGVIVLRNTGRLGTNAQTLKDALLAETGVKAVSYSDRMVFDKMSADAVRDPHQERSHILNFYCADEDQMNAMDFTLVKGRFFSKAIISDSNAVVVNEATLREFGWKDIENQEMASDGDYRYRVVGVVKDFNYESLRNDIKPLMILNVPNGSTLSVKFSKLSASDAVEVLKGNWEKHANGEPFEYSFLDSNFDALYRAEKRVGQLFLLVSGLMIFIACLGLFSLATFTAEQRVREIGIRKALGATVQNVVAMLSLQFVRYVIVAFVISIYPTYYLVSQWLSGFAYRIELGAEPFLLAGAFAIFMAIMTVSYQAIKAAVADPAKTLRAE